MHLKGLLTNCTLSWWAWTCSPERLKAVYYCKSYFSRMFYSFFFVWLLLFIYPCAINATLPFCLWLCPAGDVSPISMSPISQSQFIPLGDILCLAISAMNSARKTVTQETLIEHLATCFPGSTLHKFHDS